MRSTPGPHGNHIRAVISAAERRRLLVLAAEQAATALAVVLAGANLMLLLGTQILHWYWLGLLGIAGAGLVAVRVRSRPLAPYRLAQILDQRLHLSDALSTAWFLLSQSRQHDPVARYQLARADEIARSVRPARAFPFSGGRRWGVSGTLALLAFSLFAVRYLVTSSLSLQQTLVPVHLGPVFEAVEQSVFGRKSKAAGAFSPDSRTELAQSSRSQQDEGKERSSLQQKAQPGNPAGATPGRAMAQNGSTPTNSTETAESKPNGNPSAGHDEPQQQPNGNETAQPEDGMTKEQGKSSQQASSQNSAGALDKMKDALSSLMAKMRPNAGSEGTGHEGERSDQERKAGDQSALGRDQRGNQQNGRGDKNAQQQSTEGQARGQTTEKAENAQGRNSDTGDRKGSDSQSGAGRQDGDKSIKEAEEQQAMGKLAEIIGKRSANLTGDMTVETRSGNQQLKTEYSSRLGHHSDLGGEINRDEIPLMYQQYIRDYMEAIRKQQQRSQ